MNRGRSLLREQKTSTDARAMILTSISAGKGIVGEWRQEMSQANSPQYPTGGVVTRRSLGADPESRFIGAIRTDRLQRDSVSVRRSRAASDGTHF
jgi:hypothetical protein